MEVRILITLTVIMIVTIVTGCGPKQQDRSGFLSNYTRLEKESASSLRYLDRAALAEYSGFIVDPVKVKISLDQTHKKLTEEQLTDLVGYMNAKMIEAVKGAGKKVVYIPGTDIARIRIALTDIDRSHEVSMLPQATLLGAGIGGASVEAEIVDSVSGKQIGAIVESKQGSRIPFGSLGDWTAAKQAIDAWAKHLQARLKG